jgi:hypothetical protein
MTGSARELGRHRPRRLAGATAATAAVAAVAAAVVLGVTSGALAAAPHAGLRPAGPASAGAWPDAGGPVSGAGGTASHWAPVSYQRAQLSVPRLWLVQSRNQVWCVTKAPGMIFAGIRPKLPAGQGCDLPANLAWIVSAGHKAVPVSRTSATMINGFRAYRLHSRPGTVRYLVPKLRVRIGASGRLAKRVLGTLSWSPLAVVQRHGPASQVPPSWKWHRFGGVEFAVPPSWKPQHKDVWATCGTGQWAQTLLLINATKPPLALPCALQIPTAAAIQGEPGLTVVTGKYAAKSVRENFTRCQVSHDVRICLASDTGQGGLAGSVLIFAVSRPHQHPATYFVLGLAGSGTGARTVFDSVRMGRR